jgi:hypothetical protein
LVFLRRWPALSLPAWSDYLSLPSAAECAFERRSNSHMSRTESSGRSMTTDLSLSAPAFLCGLLQSLSVYPPSPPPPAPHSTQRLGRSSIGSVSSSIRPCTGYVPFCPHLPRCNTAGYPPHKACSQVLYPSLDALTPLPILLAANYASYLVLLRLLSCKTHHPATGASTLVWYPGRRV